jgi:aspartyl aminopeptidase
MAKKTNDLLKNLLAFLQAAPTSWHAVDLVDKELEQNGFISLELGDRWDLVPGESYRVIHQGSTLCAFILPINQPVAAHIAGSHTDSPGFKLKPKAEFQKENMTLLGLEIYGSPLLNSWLNRDLGIAGRVTYTDSSSSLKETLVRIESHPVVIPQLAIHLDRTVNDKGLILNKQEHLNALAALDWKPSKKQSSYLEMLLREQVDFRKLLATDLFLFPLEAPCFVGDGPQMISGYRIDSLASVHAALNALLQPRKVSSSILNMVVFWDHEEVGSQTSQGAGSPFLSRLLERICLSLEMDREDYFRLIEKSLCLSVDLSHALHPNYPEKHDAHHPILMNRGIVIKHNAQKRYASDADSSARIIHLCQQHNLPYQEFVTRGDIPAGTTIGPIHAHFTGMPTVDIGCGQLSMHSCRELVGCQDQLDMFYLLTAFFA